jgi:hypothetical protein
VEEKTEGGPGINVVNPAQPATFLDENRPLQELARELDLLRRHNLRFKDGDPQHHMLLLAEAALTCLTLEHFVRIVVGSEADPAAPLRTLLQMAVSRGLLTLPWDDQQDGIKRVCNVRNTLLHGNYAQAAREAGRASMVDFFRTTFASEVEAMFKVTDYVMRQINPVTGRPYEGKGAP